MASHSATPRRTGARESDFGSDPIEAKIAEAEKALVHTMLVIGGRDVDAGNVSVRLHSKGPQGAKPKGEVRAKTIGDDLVYIDAPKRYGDVTGYGYPIDWLGEKVWFVVGLPVSKSARRARLNPRTSMPEVLFYEGSDHYLPLRIVTTNEITEVSYNDYSIELTRQVYTNVGTWDLETGVCKPIKGTLLRSSKQKLTKFDDDPLNREFTREWIDARTSEKRIEVSKVE